MEEWKPMQGSEGWYEVSNTGRIRRAEPGKKAVVGRILLQQVNHRGYMQVRLSMRCKKKTITVHRAVAAAFVGEIKNDDEVNHIDGNKRNNVAENLEIVSRSENMKHAHNVLKWNPRAKLTDGQVRRIRRMRINDWDEYKRLGEEFGVSAVVIYQAKRGSSYRWIS